jgi:hypothetical protein
MSDALKFDLRDWLVPPVLLPIFFRCWSLLP